jgi:uncharacterized protein YbaR (Trm112 family)
LNQAPVLGQGHNNAQQAGKFPIYESPKSVYRLRFPLSVSQMDESLLSLIRAPHSHAPLRLAAASELDCINAKIRLGQIITFGGAPVVDDLAECLICDADATCYQVREGLPVLIADTAFPAP